MKHKFSKEILYHFNCGKCNKWWSVSDYHLLSLESNKTVTCPHCEHKALIEIKNEKK
jgi:DNA-directed RNA polymerase subunit RPC12/RpoP